MRNLVVLLAATASLLSPGTESKWRVMRGAAHIGTLTVLTSSTATRAEWKTTEKGAPEVFIGTGGTTWMRTTGGDVDVATLSALTPSRVVAPALLAPFGGTVPWSPKYDRDDKGVSKVTIKSGNDTYIVTRTSVGSSNADASNFVVRSKKTASSRLARLSGDLLGASDTSVAATAGGRGVGQKGLHLADGGDYDAVAQLENRDSAWQQKNLDELLTEFQKSGKIGRGRGGN